jgi:hypothetical protein
MIFFLFFCKSKYDTGRNIGIFSRGGAGHEPEARIKLCRDNPSNIIRQGSGYDGFTALISLQRIIKRQIL